MHVTSEEGEFSFVKLPPVRSTSKHGAHWMTPGVESAERADPDDPSLGAATVCGVYFVADPDQIIEVTMRQVNVDCRTGGLMAFVDGWELNGQYFPGERDHEKPLELRVQEFCAEQGASAGGGPWPPKTVGAASNAWVFRSSQNAALVQYRIPERGSFVLSARFHRNPKRECPVPLTNKPTNKQKALILTSASIQCSMQHHGGGFGTVLHVA